MYGGIVPFDSLFNTHTPHPPGDKLQLSSVGVGTYLGALDARTDEAVAAAVVYSVASGWNVIDTGGWEREWVGGRVKHWEQDSTIDDRREPAPWRVGREGGRRGVGSWVIDVMLANTLDSESASRWVGLWGGVG